MNKNKNPQTTHGREQNEDGKFYYGFDNPKKPGNILTIKSDGVYINGTRIPYVLYNSVKFDGKIAKIEMGVEKIIVEDYPSDNSKKKQIY
ncbi:hypothetical protein [Staphylococcus equorum]|uniref:hypothetical protein n=1 Tax=Staphylococcus equorum TaxID=246432 RepID=UPI0039B0FD97